MKNNYEDSSRASWQSKHKWISYVLVFCMILSTFVTMGPLTAYGGENDANVETTDSFELGTPVWKAENKTYNLSNLQIPDTISGIKTAVISVVGGGAAKVPSNESIIKSTISDKEETTQTIIFNDNVQTDDVQEVLQEIDYTFVNDQQINITLSSYDTNLGTEIGSNQKITAYDGHYYMYVPGKVEWTTAYSKARAMKYMGMQGYLATITSSGEDNALRQISTAGAWSGGTRAYFKDDANNYQKANAQPENVTENNASLTYTSSTGSSAYYWADGPEAGNSYGDYTAWAQVGGVNEPNNQGQNEGYMQVNATTSGGSGTWNDLPNSGDNVSGYFVEFGGYDDGKDPGYADLDAGQIWNASSGSITVASFGQAEFDGQLYKTLQEAIAAANASEKKDKTVQIISNTVNEIESCALNKDVKLVGKNGNEYQAVEEDTTISVSTTGGITLNAGKMNVSGTKPAPALITVSNGDSLNTVSGTESFVVTAGSESKSAFVTVAPQTTGCDINIDGITYRVPEGSEEIDIPLVDPLMGSDVPNGTVASIPKNKSVKLNDTTEIKNDSNSNEIQVEKGGTAGEIGSVKLRNTDEVSIAGQSYKASGNGATIAIFESKGDDETVKTQLTAGAVYLGKEKVINVAGVEVENPNDNDIIVSAETSSSPATVTLTEVGNTITFGKNTYKADTANTTFTVVSGNEISQITGGKITLSNDPDDGLSKVIKVAGVVVENTGKGNIEVTPDTITIPAGESVTIGGIEYTAGDTEAVITIKDGLPVLTSGKVDLEKGKTIYIEGKDDTIVPVKNTGKGKITVIAGTIDSDSSLIIPAGGEATVDGNPYANNGTDGEKTVNLNKDALAFVKQFLSDENGKVVGITSDNYKNFLDGGSAVAAYNTLTGNGNNTTVADAIKELLEADSLNGFDSFDAYTEAAQKAVADANAFIEKYLEKDTVALGEITADNYKQIMSGEKVYEGLIAQDIVDTYVNGNFWGPRDPNAEEDPDNPHAGQAKIENGYKELLNYAKIEASKHGGGGGSVDSFYKDRTNAITALDKYVDLSKYDADGQKAIKDILAQAKKDINGAKDKAEIDKAKAKAMALIDDVLTKAEKERIAAIGELKLVARSKLTKLNGVKAVRVHWFAKDGRDISKIFDGYTVERSTKRYSGYEKFFSTENEHYYNNKALKKGARYYYRVKGYAEINGTTYTSEWSYKAWRYVK